MNTETIPTSKESSTASSKRPSIEERTRVLNEATLNALRRAGQERKRREQEELALKETPPPHGTPEKKPTMPAA